MDSTGSTVHRQPELGLSRRSNCLIRFGLRPRPAPEVPHSSWGILVTDGVVQRRCTRELSRDNLRDSRSESLSMSHTDQESTSDFGHLWRGFVMGGADIIPGVSGGTMALVLGIYRRLVVALSHVDRQLLALLRGAQWRAAAEHLDLRFAFGVGLGILLGIGCLASIMHTLLEQYALPTWSFLFGLILGSSVLVARMIPRWSLATLLALAAGATFAYWVVGQLPTSPPAGKWYFFVSGGIAICAMILPGISGAFILLLLGSYFEVTGILKDLLRLRIGAEDLAKLVTFSVGCLVGLLSFSKLLRWLLDRWESVTLAVLCGFMLGSLRKIWPFKTDVTSADYLVRLRAPEETIAEFVTHPESLPLKYRLFANHWPATIDGETVLAAVTGIGGLLLLALLDRLARGRA